MATHVAAAGSSDRGRPHKGSAPAKASLRRTIGKRASRSVGRNVTLTRREKDPPAQPVSHASSSSTGSSADECHAHIDAPIYESSDASPNVPAHAATVRAAWKRKTLEDDWEVSEIVGQRMTPNGYEYQARWANTWLPQCALGNARRLLRDFKARGRQRRGQGRR